MPPQPGITPVYGQPAPPPSKGKGKLLIIAAVIVVLVVAAVVVFLVLHSKKNNDATSFQPTQHASQTVAVGKEADLQGLDITVSSLTTSASENDSNGFSIPPPSGQVYYDATVSINNTTDNTIDSSFTSFTLKTSDGHIYNGNNRVDGTSILPDQLSGHSTAQGVVEFTAPSDPHPAVIFDDNYISSDGNKEVVYHAEFDQ
jgi:flagellar basal body-associated protein FliL